MQRTKPVYPHASYDYLVSKIPENIVADRSKLQLNYADVINSIDNGAKEFEEYVYSLILHHEYCKSKTASSRSIVTGGKENVSHPGITIDLNRLSDEIVIILMVLLNEIKKN